MALELREKSLRQLCRVQEQRCLALVDSLQEYGLVDDVLVDQTRRVALLNLEGETASGDAFGLVAHGGGAGARHRDAEFRQPGAQAAAEFDFPALRAYRLG